MEPIQLNSGAVEISIGGFRIRREVGRGATGIVYEGENAEGRSVAVKVLSNHWASDPSTIERFQAESRVAARLEHPSIVKVLASGKNQGSPYFVMEWVDGDSLETLLDRRRKEAFGSSVLGSWEEAPGAALVTGSPEYIRETVEQIAQIADALDHAHKAGIVHRDVKPANVLIRHDGRAVLTDFGVAREKGLPGQNSRGEFAGTPYYVAPEQIRGRRAVIGPAADVFSLGATLYEALTLKRPFEGVALNDVFRAILTEEPVPPDQTNSRLSPDLSAIVLKALEKRADRRYPSAAAFAEDLRSFLDWRPVRAQRPSATRRTFRWIRRDPLRAIVWILTGRRR